MPNWPQTIPPDLRRKLENVMGYRQFGPQDLWGEIREWLVAHGVEVPGELPEVGVPANSSRSGLRKNATHQMHHTVGDPDIQMMEVVD